ncbi:MAG TPA: CoA transferase [Thermodesulfobacteriota bacterium]|nr:CoA transferase [Thermodesulfobacteriota bacterium]
MLSPYRALDLTDEKGLLCGKILADLGADVIQVEKPEGNPARALPPFFEDVAGPERSLYWLAFSAGKRSITLDWESEAGKGLFKRLAKTADFIVESFPPGYLDRKGLGYQELTKANPRLIMASIAPFGQTGPFRDYKGSDLVASAMGGMVCFTGEPDRAPVRISADLAYCQAGVHATIGLLISLSHRATTGQGQRVDVSMQASTVRTLHTQLPYWEYSHHIVQRSGIRRFRGGVSTQEIWPCKDGFVSWMFFGGAVGTQQMRIMVEWMEGKGMARSLSTEVQNWAALDLTKVDPEKIKSWEKVIGDFFLAHTKEELYQEALKKRIPLTPLNDMSEVVEDEQLAARGFWVGVDHAELRTNLRIPGFLFQTTEEKCLPKVRRRAPFIGEHNPEIYIGELGLHEDELNTLRREGIV